MRICVKYNRATSYGVFFHSVAYVLIKTYLRERCFAFLVQVEKIIVQYFPLLGLTDDKIMFCKILPILNIFQVTLNQCHCKYKRHFLTNNFDILEIKDPTLGNQCF